MLGDRLNLTIKINEDKEIDLRLTIGVIRDLYKLTGEEPFDFLKELISEEDSESLKQKVIQLLICMTDEDIFYINDNVLNNSENVETIKNAVTVFIMEEIQSEFKEQKDELEYPIEEHQVEQQERKDTFKDRYNFFYYMAKCQLHISIEEMEQMTIREMQTLIDMHVQFEKGNILRAYSDIIKAQNKANYNHDNNNNNKMLTHKKGDKVRIKDLLTNIK